MSSPRLLTGGLLAEQHLCIICQVAIGTPVWTDAIMGVLFFVSLQCFQYFSSQSDIWYQNCWSTRKLLKAQGREQLSLLVRMLHFCLKLDIDTSMRILGKGRKSHSHADSYQPVPALQESRDGFSDSLAFGKHPGEKPTVLLGSPLYQPPAPVPSPYSETWPLILSPSNLVFGLLAAQKIILQPQGLDLC